MATTLYFYTLLLLSHFLLEAHLIRSPTGDPENRSRKHDINMTRRVDDGNQMDVSGRKQRGIPRVCIERKGKCLAAFTYCCDGRTCWPYVTKGLSLNSVEAHICLRTVGYEIYFQTGLDEGSGTDKGTSVRLIGTELSTQWFILYLGARGEGSYKLATVYTYELDEVVSVGIWLHDKGLKEEEWFLQYVTVKYHGDTGSKSSVYNFGQWLGRSKTSGIANYSGPI